MKLKLFNTFKMNEKYDFNTSSNDDMEDMKNELISALDEFKDEILKNISYNVKTNKIELKGNFKNINISAFLDDLNEEFGEELIKELNVEALLRKTSQNIDLRRRNTIKKIRSEFKSYIQSLENRIKDKKDKPDDDDHFDKIDGEWSILPRRKYEGEKYELQIELLKLQEWVVKNKKQIAIVFEGRDAAGKGSTIKRFIEYLNPKYFKVVALGIPTEDEKTIGLKDMKNTYQIQEKLYFLIGLGIIVELLSHV